MDAKNLEFIYPLKYSENIQQNRINTVFLDKIISGDKGLAVNESSLSITAASTPKQESQVKRSNDWLVASAHKKYFDAAKSPEDSSIMVLCSTRKKHGYTDESHPELFTLRTVQPLQSETTSALKSQKNSRFIYFEVKLSSAVSYTNFLGIFLGFVPLKNYSPFILPSFHKM